MSTRNINLLSKYESAFAEKSWNDLLNLLNPKLFITHDFEELIAFPLLAKVAQILVTEDPIVPNNIKIACLKCMGNSCYNSYVHKDYASTNTEHGRYCHKLYSMLANNEKLKEIQISNSYPFDSYFPYEGVIEWTSTFITSCKINSDLPDEEVEILRLCIQFLCNLFTFACKDNSFPDSYNIPQYLYDTNLKNIIIDVTNVDHIQLVRASCGFIHNALKEFGEEIFTNAEKTRIFSQLLKPIKSGFESAREAMMLLLCQTRVLQSAYNNITTEDKVYLLQLIYNELSNSTNDSQEEYVLANDTIRFLIERFCRRSDLILETVDTHIDEMESTEIVILLDILGTLTSGSYKEYSFLKGYKSLLINCTYLLKSIQMIGKQSDNYFTPLQKLSDVALAMQEARNNEPESSSNGVEVARNETEENSVKCDLQSHPAFGFKAGLIRIIGNMSYRNKECQDLLREMDAIPLLLDCCNIDARNPLIMQWTILALRNLCEDNPANQKIIQDCTRVGIVENSVLQEMGVTLHEDEEERKVGIVPLPRDEKS
ncbi:atxn10 [Anthophora plagiata]